MSAVPYIKSKEIEFTQGGILDARNRHDWAKGFVLDKKLVFHPYTNKDFEFGVTLQPMSSVK